VHLLKDVVSTAAEPSWFRKAARVMLAKLLKYWLPKAVPGAVYKAFYLDPEAQQQINPDKLHQAKGYREAFVKYKKELREEAIKACLTNLRSSNRRESLSQQEQGGAAADDHRAPAPVASSYSFFSVKSLTVANAPGKAPPAAKAKQRSLASRQNSIMSEEDLRSNAETIVDGEMRAYGVLVAKGPELDKHGNALPNDAMAWWSHHSNAFPYLTALMMK
jgi:hypothetical protein